MVNIYRITSSLLINEPQVQKRTQKESTRRAALMQKDQTQNKKQQKVIRIMKTT